MTTNDTLTEIRRQAEKALIARAQEDASFRALLKDNPHAALKEMLGVDPVPSLKINVVEEKPGEITIVLPAAIDESELPDELLDLASGGTSFSAFILYPPSNTPPKPKKNK